jgi:molecular chaperone DnaK (HSP70)
VQTFVEEVMGRKPLRHIDPDKAVALGAAVQIGKNST